jgi:ParB/RepB/Spo0J family partition protein
MKTAGAATGRFAHGWEEGLAAKLKEKTKEAEELAVVVADLRKLGVEWKILPIDPSLVDVVGFNRFGSTFDATKDRAFADLLANIEAVGGNKQPGMVRPSPTAPGRFQLVFGERRLRACEQANLEFTAIVASLDDDDVWLFREAENFGRADKGILEKALGLIDMPARFGYGERSVVLEKLKISKSQLARLRGMAGVPISIWSALPVPHGATQREAETIVEAFKADPKSVKSRVGKIKPEMSRAEAVRVLCGSSDHAAASSAKTTVVRKGATIRFTAASDELAQELESKIRQWLEERGIAAESKE